MRIIVVVSQAVTRHAVAAVSQRCSVSGKRAWSSSSASGTRSRKFDVPLRWRTQATPRGRRSGRHGRNRRSCSLRAPKRGCVPADRASARPTRSTQSSISTATWSESPSSKLSRIKSPRANFRSCAGPAPTASRPPPDRPRTPLIAKIEPPSSTRHRWRLLGPRSRRARLA